VFRKQLFQRPLTQAYDDNGFITFALPSFLCTSLTSGNLLGFCYHISRFRLTCVTVSNQSRLSRTYDGARKSVELYFETCLATQLNWPVELSRVESYCVVRPTFSFSFPLISFNLIQHFYLFLFAFTLSRNTNCITRISVPCV
jgi:hypothetical protein